MTVERISGKEGAEILKKGIVSIGVMGLAEPKKGEEKKDQSYNNEEFIPWFDTDNKFPRNITERGRTSTTHSRIIRAKVTYTIGDGFIFDTDGNEGEEKKIRDWANAVNSKGQTLEEVAVNYLTDKYETGNGVFEIIEHQSQLLIEHKDMTCVRVQKKNEGVLFSRDFDNYRTKKEFTPVLIPYYPNFQSVKDADKKALPGRRSAIHVKDYSPGYFWYGLPQHYPAYISGWLDIDYHIPKYNLTRFHNQFRPSGILVLVGNNLDEKGGEALKEDLNKQLVGEGKNSKMIVAVVNDETMAPKWMPFDDAPEGAFRELQDIANENIIVAHGWHPALVVQTPGNLSNSAEIIAAYETVMSEVIKPEQNRLCATLLKVISKQFPSLKGLSISNCTPVSFKGLIDVKQVLTIDEQRAELGYPELDNDMGKALLKPIKENGTDPANNSK